MYQIWEHCGHQGLLQCAVLQPSWQRAQLQEPTCTSTAAHRDERLDIHKIKGITMPVDSGILTTLLQAFMAVYSSGIGNITPDAERFLFLLGGIELATAALFWALGGDDFFVELFKKILVIGFFAWFVLNWPYFINQIGQGFVDIGFKAGGGKAALADFNDPSSIIDIGFKAVSPIDAKIQTLSFTDVGPYIIYGWSMISILTAFAILAIQVFITQLEFYLLTCLALALVPFGINRWTAFMSEKAFGLVFSFGVKIPSYRN
jgi:type IV secretion system protein TrbL